MGVYNIIINSIHMKKKLIFILIIPMMMFQSNGEDVPFFNEKGEMTARKNKERWNEALERAIQMKLGKTKQSEIIKFFGNSPIRNYAEQGLIELLYVDMELEHNRSEFKKGVDSEKEVIALSFTFDNRDRLIEVGVKLHKIPAIG